MTDLDKAFLFTVGACAFIGYRYDLEIMYKIGCSICLGTAMHYYLKKFGL